MSVVFKNPLIENDLWRNFKYFRDEDPLSPDWDTAEDLLEHFPKKGETMPKDLILD